RRWTARQPVRASSRCDPGASMGMHQDRNENSLAPVVSLSIGDEALFRIGSTETRNQPWDEVTLISGDVIVFGGPKRLAFHGVPQTRPETLPDGCGLKEGRINITFRHLDDRYVCIRNPR